MRPFRGGEGQGVVAEPVPGGGRRAYRRRPRALPNPQQIIGSDATVTNTSETGIADWFIAAVRERRIKNWGWFEMDGRLHLTRHEHPNVWMWIVNGPSSMSGFTRVTPYDFHQGRP